MNGSGSLGQKGDKDMLTDCDNCQDQIGPGTCQEHYPGSGMDQDCDRAYHYLGQSPREFPNAGKGEPVVLCGVCFRLLRGHRGPALRAREGW